jgi:hypothetical protein
MHSGPSARRSSRRRAGRRAALLALAALAVCAVALLSGCSGEPQALSAPARPPGTAPPPARPPGTVPPPAGPLVDPRLKVGEWRHAWQVVGLLRARPPKGPVVLYFGDSTARESLVSDASWTRELRHLGAPVTGYTLASHAQSFRTDRRFLDALPRLHGIALIGVGLSRFIVPLVRGPMGRPATFKAGSRPKLSPWPRHYFDARGPKTPAAKQARVAHWQESRVGQFRRLRNDNFRALAKVVLTARRRGLRPVLVQLPLNVAAVGGRLGPERAAMARGCRAVARRLHVRFLDFQVAPGLPSADFYDMCHLLRPGAVRWQRGLARWTVRLLRGGPGRS